MLTPRPNSMGYGRQRQVSALSTKKQANAPPVVGHAKIADYKFEKRLGQGSFGVVFRGRNRKGKLVAIKLILQREAEHEFPVTAFRECSILRKLKHDNVIELLEIISDVPSQEFLAEHLPKNGVQYKKGRVYFMVFPYLNYDLCGILRNDQIELNESDRKSLMMQLFRGINYIHEQKFLHRDIKAANLLINQEGVLKIADFGLVKKYTGPDPTFDKPGGGKAPLTEVVMTRWYRAPEVLFGDRLYTTAIDLWGIGCVLGELFEKTPIMNGNSDLNQAYMIFDLVGNPDPNTRKLNDWIQRYNAIIPPAKKPSIDSRFSYLSSECLDLLKQLLELDPQKRITGLKALEHPWFKTEPLPTEHIDVAFPDCHESDVPVTTAQKSRNHTQSVPPQQALPPAQPQQPVHRIKSSQHLAPQSKPYQDALSSAEKRLPDAPSSLPVPPAFPTPAFPQQQYPAANPSFRNGNHAGVRPKNDFITPPSKRPYPQNSQGYPPRNERFNNSNNNTPPRSFGYRDSPSHDKQQQPQQQQQQVPYQENKRRHYNNYDNNHNGPYQEGGYGDHHKNNYADEHNGLTHSSETGHHDSRHKDQQHFHHRHDSSNVASQNIPAPGVSETNPPHARINPQQNALDEPSSSGRYYASSTGGGGEHYNKGKRRASYNRGYDQKNRLDY